MSGSPGVHPLKGDQRRAVDPLDSVWLSASAGTGKTQVLTSRVLRLLLQPDVAPSQVLCLTFTKAGATEMAARINDTLAQWVRLDPRELAFRLEAIGAATDEVTLARARTLFARVLDSPGGGLRIDTIHAFSQWLLAAFPGEVGLVAGARPMEDRERALLVREVLAELLSDPANAELAKAAAQLSVRSGPDAVTKFLLRCAGARRAWFGPGSWQPADMRGHVLRLLGLPEDAGPEWLTAMCADDAFDTVSLRRCMEINRDWGKKTGIDMANGIGAWLALDADGRVAALNDLVGAFYTAKGKPKSTTNQQKFDDSYDGYCERVIGCLEGLREAAGLLALAERLVPALTLGRAFALAWDEAKTREGLIDFDDQIALAARLLVDGPEAEWIRYKLDRRFDHILVDEAQDTNAAQWAIVDALTEEFYAGFGQRDDKVRTLFVVGDYKQAIFGFQGTSPEEFEKAKLRVRDRMRAAAEAASGQRGGPQARELVDAGLGQSFRTASDVLKIVDDAIAAIGPENLGLRDGSVEHLGQERPGYVAIWDPVAPKVGDGDDEGSTDEVAAEGDDGEAQGGDWLSRPDRRMAEQLARQIKSWVGSEAPGFYLHKSGRRAEPGDVMVLVRKRKALAALIVARLHAEGVPVAGVDRLRLGAPLAVQDLVAALRFASQPLDDLNLASLLVSPLIGWSQEQLLAHGYREKHGKHRDPLWQHLRSSEVPEVRDTVARLVDLLSLADLRGPQALLHWLLVGPWQGRRKLIARLGHEAGDPIDELVSAAGAFAAGATASLAGFIAWFDASDEELKREPGGAGNVVRVMTAHGSKGLQAPIVVLADAAGNPDPKTDPLIDLADPRDPDRLIPLPPMSKAEKAGPVAERIAADKAAALKEHWRLLYVAMTRAEEALFVGGALAKNETEPRPNSWYARLSALFPDDDAVEDPIWGTRREWGSLPREHGLETEKPDAAPHINDTPLPRWLHQERPDEPRPPRPLTPSSLGEDEAPDPPFPPGAGMEAARRGTLVHRLLERLPDVPVDQRGKVGGEWLQRQAPDLGEATRTEMLDSALAVIADPAWSDLFGPGSLAEVPVAAVVGANVIAGTIDRLCVEDDKVRLVDFKTARRPPADVDGVPRRIVRQMAAYVAALERTFPGRRVEAALLYTAAPRLIVLPDALVAANKPDLPGAQ